MKLGVSNIGWPQDKVNSYASLAVQLGFDYVEAGFTKIPSTAPVLATQSIFYGADISSFQQVDQVCTHLIRVLEFCKSHRIQVITLGSPSMRKGDKAYLLHSLQHIASILGNVSICIEPNASKYGGDYYHTLDAIVPDLPTNIATMIDTGNLILENVNCFTSFERYQHIIRHIHFSTPTLKAISDFGFYKEFLSFLKERYYTGLVTYELIDDDIERHMQTYIENIRST